MRRKNAKVYVMKINYERNIFVELSKRIAIEAGSSPINYKIYAVLAYVY